jgi:hypothetical protein
MSSNSSKPEPRSIRPADSHLISNGLWLRQHAATAAAGRDGVSVTQSIAEWIILTGILVQIAKTGLPDCRQ